MFIAMKGNWLTHMPVTHEIASSSLVIAAKLEVTHTTQSERKCHTSSFDSRWVLKNAETASESELQAQLQIPKQCTATFRPPREGIFLRVI